MSAEASHWGITAKQTEVCCPCNARQALLAGKEERAIAVLLCCLAAVWYHTSYIRIDTTGWFVQRLTLAMQNMSTR